MKRYAFLVLLFLLLGRTETVSTQGEHECFWAWALKQPATVQVVEITYDLLWVPVRLDGRYIVPDQRWVILEVSAYNSLPEQTDDTPFITANGERVRWGIVASNIFPFGTVIRVPTLFGEQTFVVVDRMNQRYHVDDETGVGFADIWMEEWQDAIRFGRQRTLVQVLHNPLADADM